MIRLGKIQRDLIRFGVYVPQKIAFFERQRKAINNGAVQGKLSPKEELELYSYLILLGGNLRGRVSDLFLKYERLTFPAEEFDGESLAQIENKNNPPVYYGYTFESKSAFPSWEITFQEGEIVWDIGCGNTRDAIYWATNYPRSNFVGCDANPRNIKDAILHLQKMEAPPGNLRLVVGDFCDQDISPGSITTLVMKGTLAGMRHDMRKRLLESVIDKISPTRGRIFADFIIDDLREKSFLMDKIKEKGAKVTLIPLVPNYKTVDEEEVPYLVSLSKP